MYIECDILYVSDAQYLINTGCTVVSRASTHSWVSAHVPHFRGHYSSFYTNVWKFDPR